MLSGRATARPGGVFLRVSDIIEPNPAWREYKRQLTQREWDYDFRRLFFTWASDITSGKFQPWVEIASREKTCGWIFPCDLWAEADGTVHLLWNERAIDVRLREKFFPSEKQSESLEYAKIRDGKVIFRRSILRAEEGETPLPERGRFHVMPDGRLFVFFHVLARNANGGRTGENRLVTVHPDGSLGAMIPVPLKRPLGTFFTASIRSGCAPSAILDVLGDAGGAARYVRIRLAE